MLLKVGASLPEMSQQEKTLDAYIEMLKTDQVMKVTFLTKGTSSVRMGLRPPLRFFENYTIRYHFYRKIALTYDLSDGIPPLIFALLANI